MESQQDYKAAVGPPQLYDLIGAQQFCLLVKHGLRAKHKLLDIGCGSLRGGRFFILYLDQGNYYGIEPNEPLVAEGIDKEIGLDLIDIKLPNFYFNANFDFQHFGVKFDYILAQSILSHTDQIQVHTCLQNAAKTLKPRGKFFFTFFRGARNYSGVGWTRNPSAYYQQAWMLEQVRKVGLTPRVMDIPHPSNQTWVLATW